LTSTQRQRLLVVFDGDLNVNVEAFDDARAARTSDGRVKVQVQVADNDHEQTLTSTSHRRRRERLRSLAEREKRRSLTAI
jgi:hypothetical protein